jgi:hypothetical protein
VACSARDESVNSDVAAVFANMVKIQRVELEQLWGAPYLGVFKQSWKSLSFTLTEVTYGEVGGVVE